eukprot:scaffold102849_cov48-Phaeocystis_antarctica.AAC.1
MRAARAAARRAVGGRGSRGCRRVGHRATCPMHLPRGAPPRRRRADRRQASPRVSAAGAGRPCGCLYAAVSPTEAAGTRGYPARVPEG